MKSKKMLFPILIIIGFILGLSGLYLYNKDVSTSNTVNDSELKEAAIRKFYSSYSNKSIDIFNDSVIDYYKVTTGEGKQSVRKVIVRKDKKSPWLVAGQIDGHGY